MKKCKRCNNTGICQSCIKMTNKFCPDCKNTGKCQDCQGKGSK